MKSLLLTIALVFGSSAYASFDFNFPNMDSMINAQKAAIKADKGVKAHAATSGGIKSVSFSGDSFTVETKKSCSFDVIVAYADGIFNGITSVDVVPHTTSCK